MPQHSITILKTAVCGILNVDPEEALKRVPWLQETHKSAHLGVTGAEYFAFWETIIELAGPNPDLIALGKAMANGPVVAIFLAFASAPNLEQAFHRFARYKSLCGPVMFCIGRTSKRLKVEIMSEYDQLSVPSTLVLSIGIFVLEKSRNHSARNIIPCSVTLPDGIDPELVKPYFNVDINVGSHFAIEFSDADARIPFISENEPLWMDIKLDLERQLNERDSYHAFHLRVEAAIRKLLNTGTGPAQVETVCYHMGISRSTMQRNLKEEDKSYQQILDEVRIELADRYLAKTALKLDQIASLVGFTDPKSFHRAFKSWTGMTPQQFRENKKISMTQH